MMSRVKIFEQASQHHHDGRLREAESLYWQILEKDPNHPEALHGLGLLAFQAKKYDIALDLIGRAATQNPATPQFHYNLGLIWVALKKPEKAVAALGRAIKIKSDYGDAHYNLGILFQAQDEPDQAIIHFRQAIQFQPQAVDAYYNLGNVLKNLGQFEEAIENYKNAIKLKPDFPEALNNIGLTLKEQGHVAAAIKCYSRALEHRPDFAEAHWNRALAYLLVGNFRDGWPEYEWRFRRGDWQRTPRRHQSKTTWDGSNFEGKRLLVYAEQGLGDTLQFVRYLPRVKALGGKVILEASRTLHGLLEGLAGVDELVDPNLKNTPSIDHDLSVPLLSLPGIFKTELDTIPGTVPYIFASNDKIDLWRKCLGEDGFRVGVVWAGRPEHKNDRNRSCPLEWFIPLAGIDGVQLYGLQKGAAALEVADLPESLNFTNLGDEFENFPDTAGAIENLDLVISVDTAVAHLAGAMGKPVWVLLPYAPDWRWLVDRQDSPWYPTMTLFRQKTAGDWGVVFDRLMKEFVLAKKVH
ncbi:FIG140336: TPR domain protein [Olavius algarvensis Delta 1 endosymbiont]|nr:FIG140336: TPR domain protein [Olavius algarvensis Delta 1 endosymbiont]